VLRPGEDIEWTWSPLPNGQQYVSGYNIVKGRAILRQMLSPLEIWLPLGMFFVGWSVASGIAGGWNRYWLFAIGCWFVLDMDWAFAARHARIPVFVKASHLTPLLTFLVYALYCLPLSSVPLLGQRVVPRFVSLEILGALMCAAGVGFAIWARHILSDSWNAGVARHESGAFIQHGPYALVRHPIYLGFLVAVIGMVLILGEARALVLLFGVGVLLRKMGHEERLLRAEFPSEYAEYERRVKRLMPCIW
jgi:protein-S-isoprenylcysteine O-methyltransferase Ste14